MAWPGFIRGDAAPTVCSFQYSGVFATFLKVFLTFCSLFAACVFCLVLLGFMFFLLLFSVIFSYVPSEQPVLDFSVWLRCSLRHNHVGLLHQLRILEHIVSTSRTIARGLSQAICNLPSAQAGPQK